MKNNYTPKSIHIDIYLSLLSKLSSLIYVACLELLNFALFNLVQIAQTCVTAAHLIDIDENELELFQSDRCKYGDLTADEFDSLQYLYAQAIEALKDEQASLCGGIE